MAKKGPLSQQIHDPVDQGDLEQVKTLLQQDPNLVISMNEDGGTPFHAAARAGDLDVVKLLLANKADVNARDSAGIIPVHLAAAMKNVRVVELPLNNRAEVNARARLYNATTPLRAAQRYGSCWNTVPTLV